MLMVENLRKRYDNKDVDVIKNISINFPNKGVIFLLGKSGCGKTTLLNLLGGIDTPTGGDIHLDGKKYSSMTEKQKDELRNADISFVFQDFNLLQDLNVLENVILPLKIQEEDGKEDKTKYELAKDVLKKVDLIGYEKRMPNELSGGQIQRVAIARAMIKSPRILLADEPTGNLDTANGKMVFEALRKNAESCLVIIVTHDEEAAYKYGDRVIHIEDGNIISDKQLNEEDVEIEYSIYRNDKQVKTDISNPDNAQNVITTEINKYILENEDIDVKVKLKKIKKDNKKDNDNLSIRKEIKVKPFSTGEILRFSKNNMKNHKKHIVITTLIMLLTIMLIMLSALLSKYDSLDPIEKYLNEYKVDRLSLYTNATYTSTFGEEKLKELSVGKYFDATLEDKLLDNRIKVVEDEYIDYNMLFFGYCNVFLLNGDYGICEDIVIGKDEVVITEYVAESIGMGDNPVGKKMTIGLKEYTVIACIDSVDNTELTSKFSLYDEQQDLYEIYYTANFFDVVFINESDYVEARMADTRYISTECADFLNYKYERYFTKNIAIGNVASLKEEALLYGEFPDEPNEIMISIDYAVENGLLVTEEQSSDEIMDMEFEFKDIHNGYDNYFTDTINMKDYFDGKIKIVGIYEAENYSSDYMVNDEIYKKMLDDYYINYYYDRSFLYVEPRDYIDVIAHIKTYSSEINEPSINKIYEFEDLLESIKKAIIFLLIVLSSIAIFMIYHNINISLIYNRKTIGVLRSIGVSKKCTIKIFLIEAFVICTLSCIFATIFGIFVTNFVNGSVRADVKINPYDLLIWDWLLAMAIILISSIIFLFTAVIPIFNYAKKPPIQVIRGI